MKWALTLAGPALLLGAAAPMPQALQQARQMQTASQAAAKAAADQAAAIAAEADKLAAARVEAARTLRETEDGLASVAVQISELQAQRDTAAAAAAVTAERLQPLLPLATRLGFYPIETLLTVPVAPEQAVRGVLVLQSLAHQLGHLVQALSSEQARAAAAARALAQARQVSADLAQRQHGLAADLDTRIAAAQAARDRAMGTAADAARRAAQDAARADTLRAAIARLEATRQAEARRAAAAAPAVSPTVSVEPPATAGRWVMPVAGRLTQTFGAATDAGPASGTILQTPQGARVVAACGGRVAFAGPFRSYGELVIVACGGGLHVVLAGLGRIDVAAGQLVRTGEPVGIMGDGRSTLYVEIRLDGVAIDPSQYLRQNG